MYTVNKHFLQNFQWISSVNYKYKKRIRYIWIFQHALLSNAVYTLKA